MAQSKRNGYGRGQTHRTTAVPTYTDLPPAADLDHLDSDADHRQRVDHRHGSGGLWLLAAATSPAAFALANAVCTSWFGDLVFTGSAWALWYHYLAGLRHLYFDAGHGLDVPTAEKLGWGVIIGSVVLTLLTILIV